MRKGLNATALRAFLVLLVLAMGVLWIYAFFLAPSGNPDRLQDRAWSTAAEIQCAEALARISLLPTAASASDPADRAEDLDAATAIVRSLADDLTALSGGTNEDKEIIAQWLAAWGVYLADRQAHAKRLRDEGDVKPLLTALPSGAGSVLERMNGFARVNDMESCLDPGDM